MSNKIVRVFVEGGIIKDVQVPDGVLVEVFDFDIDGADDAELACSPDGEKCFLSRWVAT